MTINSHCKHSSLITISVIIMSAFLYLGAIAQTPNFIPKYTSNSTANSQLFDNGTSIGIGLSQPASYAKLDVNGNIQSLGDVILGGTNSWVLHTPDDGRTTMHFTPKINGNWVWSSAAIFSNNGDFQLSGNAILGGTNSWVLHTPDDGRTTMHFAPKIGGNWDFSKGTVFSNNGDVLFSGKIRIGSFTNEPNINNYFLAVNGKIGAKEEVVVVAMNTPWPDYVFDSSYKRMNLFEKEAFFKKYKHLPGIDSEKEIEQNGLKMAQTLAGITQNVEENALDIIELSKQNTILKEELELLKKELSALKNR